MRDTRIYRTGGLGTDQEGRDSSPFAADEIKPLILESKRQDVSSARTLGMVVQDYS